MRTVSMMSAATILLLSAGAASAQHSVTPGAVPGIPEPVELELSVLSPSDEPPVLAACPALLLERLREAM
ncbi:hypothetical protein JW921_11660, partial [Candidatus Fermentibacterales bacterium]|nr:hypothetical protein [Candidatus Fermentibacterales bacterium]